MPRKRSTEEVLAEAATDETRQFVRKVRRATRRKFTPEEKVRVVLEGLHSASRLGPGGRHQAPGPQSR